MESPSPQINKSPDQQIIMKKAIFIDKDGTLIEDVPYNCDLTRIKLMASAVAGLRMLHAAEYALIVISNQAGVAHGPRLVYGDSAERR
jgi:histidinol phosphatase-like enzyme